MSAVIQYVMPKFNFMKIMSKKFNGEVEYFFLQYTVSHRGINCWNLYRKPKITIDTTDTDFWVQLAIKAAYGGCPLGEATIDKMLEYNGKLMKRLFPNGRPKIKTNIPVCHVSELKDLMNDYEAETKSRQAHEEIADLD